MVSRRPSLCEDRFGGFLSNWGQILRSHIFAHLDLRSPATHLRSHTRTGGDYIVPRSTDSLSMDWLGLMSMDWR